MIVGRDTAVLSAEGITKAAVETVAENTSDGSIAPLFFMLLGGPAAGFAYKAVNTMDSMLGYKNEKYLYFGRPAARLDDVVNFIPSRLAALLMIAAAWLCGMDGKGAFRIWRRDRFQHAGALGGALAGVAVYFGKVVKKPFIGDGKRPVEPEDIARANRLLYVSASLLCAAGLLIRCVLPLVF